MPYITVSFKDLFLKIKEYWIVEEQDVLFSWEDISGEYQALIECYIRRKGLLYYYLFTKEEVWSEEKKMFLIRAEDYSKIFTVPTSFLVSQNIKEYALNKIISSGKYGLCDADDYDEFVKIYYSK